MKVWLSLAVRIASLVKTSSSFAVATFRTPRYSKFRILHRLRSVSLPVMRKTGYFTPRPLPYTILGGFLGLLWGDGDKQDAVPQYIKRQLLKAERAMREGDYVAAGGAYHRALGRLGQSQFADSQVYLEARAVVLDKLANMYLEQGLLPEAEVAFKETMIFMLRAGTDKESAEMVEISLKLSKIYTNQNKQELAETGFSWCVVTAEKLCSISRTDNNLALWGMCLQNQGQYHLSRGHWGQAVLCLREALQLSMEVFRPSHLQVAVLHNDLATALEGAGQWNEAESHARTSLEVMVSGSHSTSDIAEHLARVQFNLGMILRRQGKDSEARDALTRALEGARQLRDRPLQRHIQHLLDQIPK